MTTFTFPFMGKAGAGHDLLCCCCGAPMAPHSATTMANAIKQEEGPRRAAYELGLSVGWTPAFDFVVCGGCGFMRLAEMPPPEVITAFYASYNRTANYLAKRDKKIRRAMKRIRSLARKAKGRRFLDIGCNAGFAVEAARRLGFDATGVDLDNNALSAARAAFPGCRFMHGDLSSLASDGEKFDLIFCSEVIKHISDPPGFIRAAAAVAAPGALMYVATPDLGHWRTPREYWQWEEVRPPEHICWFTKQALAKVFTHAGFVQPRAAFRLKTALRMTAVMAD